MNINDFIKFICKELNIECPEISYDESKLIGETMLALYDGEKIYLKNKEIDPDTLFAIAHELRHAWQIKNNEEYFLGNYKNRMETDIESYNMQIAEIDANAFATIIMIDIFKIKPLFQGMTEKTIKTIEKRIGEIIEEEYGEE